MNPVTLLSKVHVWQLKHHFYTKIFDFSSSRENETKLLQQAKDCVLELEKQKAELEKADNFPESSNTEVTKMRQQLLKYNNEYKQAQERQYQLEYQIEM